MCEKMHKNGPLLGVHKTAATQINLISFHGPFFSPFGFRFLGIFADNANFCHATALIPIANH